MSEKSRIITQVRREGRVILTEIEAKVVLREAGIPVVEAFLAKSRRKAMEIAAGLGFPVVLKIASPDITHKSDIGGVRVGLKSKAEVARAYGEIIKAAKEKYPAVKIDGVAVQKMAPSGLEVIIGVSKDAQFGHVLMFGLGGIFVEILKDVSFRIIPVSQRDAAEMIREIKGYPLLIGYRGHEPVAVSAIEEMLLKVSEFVTATPEVKEIDLNPVFAYKDGALAVDARIILEAEGTL